jgi:hypothetical protein
MTVIETARLLKPIQPFDAANFRRDLRIAALRAGVLGSGRVAPGLHVLRAASGSELATVLADPVSRGLVAFALDEQRIR